MGRDTKSFLKIKREGSRCRPLTERIKDYREVSLLRADETSKEQAYRCMDCGTPFCHWACPLGNYIPEWNDVVSGGRWEEAVYLSEAMNNLGEVTGRICPALCEYSCVLALDGEAVTIRENELAVVEYGFKHKLIKPRPPQRRTGRKVAVVGSGPAGLSAAARLNQAGHHVVLFERDDKIGGLLRYGIPDFKLEKHFLDRRVAIWEKEGIVFKTKVNVGKDYALAKLRKDFDAVCLATGACQPRDLKIPGRELEGIYFAMDFLVQANRRVAGEKILAGQLIDAKGKRVVVIGGGDTGADCIGTCHRQAAKSVVQIEIMPKPPECRPDDCPWPKYPSLLKTSTSHDEGGRRYWQVSAKKFLGKSGRVEKISCVKVEFSCNNEMREVPGSEFEIEADMVILAIGFLHTEHKSLANPSLSFDRKGNIKTDTAYMTSLRGVFAAGDARRGQSLVVWAISEGRKASRAIDEWLMGQSRLSVI